MRQGALSVTCKFNSVQVMTPIHLTVDFFSILKTKHQKYFCFRPILHKEEVLVYKSHKDLRS